MPKGNARGSGYERKAHDWYVEPARAVHALLDREEFEGCIWDPACGGGNIPRVCLERGLEAIGTDIVQRGGAKWTSDFLKSLDRAANIITNPPFNLATEFTLHALDRADRKVAILQKTVWLEGARRHKALFSLGRLARVWQFSSRISMPPGDEDVPAQNGSVAYAWFVFDNQHAGPFIGGWIP